MPNFINADNGVVSGFAGVRTTADGTDNLALQSNGVTLVTLATNNTVTISGTTSQTGNASFGNVTTTGALSAASASFTAALPVASGGTGVTTSTGTGSTVLSASPTFTGTPLSTTAASGTNTTQIATTAFAYGTFSAGGNGYQKFASGLIVQWGATVGTSPTTQNLPITFPTATLGGPIVSNGDYGASTATCGITGASTSQITLNQNGGGAYRWNWIVFGY
jgi:hypothetical protein